MRGRINTVQLAVATGLLMVLTGCGGSQPVPLPPPPPVPQGPGGFSYGGGGSCGFSGVPLRPNITAPFYGEARGYMGGLNTFNLNVGYAQNVYGGSFQAPIVGSLNIQWPDEAIFGQLPANFPAQFCASSQSIQGGQPMQGTYDQTQNVVRLSMQGLVQLPVYGSTVQVPATVQVAGQIVWETMHFYGQVTIQLQGQQPVSYQVQ